MSDFFYFNPGLLEDIAGLARTEYTLILTSSRPELCDVGSHRKKKHIVQEYKIILNAITSVAVHPTFQLRELFVCFGRLNRILAVISFTNPGIMYKTHNISA